MQNLALLPNAIDPDHLLTWIGLPERTLALGRPAGPWTVVGAGAATWIRPDGPSLA